MLASCIKRPSILRSSFRCFSLGIDIDQKKIDTKVCTPIYYVNGEPHIGHIYSTTFADAISLWNRVKGKSTFMTTGTDEHGQKVQREAEKRKMDVQRYCDGIASKFQSELDHYSLSIGRFIRTTDADHISKVKSVWSALMQNGDLYQDTYRGFYCRSDEAFLTQKQVIEKDGKLFCKENGNAVEIVEEQNWMFRLQKYKTQLLDFLTTHPEWIQPSNFHKEILNIIEDSTADLSVSRPLTRVPWAITTEDEVNGIYVWIDALCNYLTTNVDKEFNQTIHVFGKDIIKFHCYFYPCLLMALGRNN